MTTEPLAARRSSLGSVDSGQSEAEHRLQLMAEHSTDVLCELYEGVVVYISPNSSRLSGHPPSYFLGRSIASEVHPDDIHLLASFMAPGWTGDVDVTIRLAGAEGAWGWREARGTRTIDAEGRHRAVLVLRDVDRRREAEEELRLSESRAKALLAAIPDLMFRMTRAGVYLDFKADRNEDLYVPAHTIIGSNMGDILPPEVSELAFAGIARALDEGGVETFEYSLVKKGIDRRYEARVTACADDEVVVLCRDITEQNRAERELREGEQRYRALVEGARDCVYTHDAQGNFTSVNAMAMAMYGYTREEFLSLNIADFLAPASLERAQNEMASAMDGHDLTYGLELLTYRKDGSPLWVEVVASATFEDDVITGFQGISRDINERKAADERIRFQAQLLDAVPQAVMVIDVEGHITFWNHFAEQLYGWSSNDVLGKKAVSFMRSENLHVGAVVMKAVARGEHWVGELTVQERGGRQFPALFLTAPMYDAAGTLIGGTCVSTEITTLKAAELEAQHVDQRAAVLNERARIASELHDNVAQFFFSIGIASQELLERKSTPPTVLRRRLAHIRKMSADGGREIRNAIRAFAPSGEGDDLDASIQQLFAPLIEHGVDVSFDRDPLEGSLRPEVEREIYRLAREALFNTRKHARASRVDVRIVASVDDVVLTVADDGVGTAAAIRDRMGHGTGYGLKILSDRLRALGGELEIADGREQGVVLRFRLPREAR